VQDDDAAGKVATIGSCGGGIIFAVGWYIFLGALFMAHTDCIVWSSLSDRELVNCTAENRTWQNDVVAPEALRSGAYWAPGILASFGLVGLNLISWEAVVEEGSFGDGVVVCARLWILCSLVLLFGGLGTAIWCLVTDLQTPKGWHAGGICTFIQTLLILVAAFVFRLVRRSGDHAI